MNIRTIATLVALAFLSSHHIRGDQIGENPQPVQPTATYRLLVFHLEADDTFSHSSIANGIAMFEHMGDANGFEVVVSEDPALFNDDTLKQFHAVVFLNTSGDFFDESQKRAFQNFIRSGKGWLGTHCADNTLNGWSWYHEMIGSIFRGDRWNNSIPLIKVAQDHPSTQDLPDPWVISEQYRKNTWLFDENTAEDKGFTVLYKVDPEFYEGKTGDKPGDWANQSFVPYVYTREFEGGRIWYGSMGHADATFNVDGNWYKLMEWGVDYAFGKFVEDE